MGKIADVFFQSHLDGNQLQLDVQKQGDKAGQTLGQRLKAGFTKSSMGLADGIKLGAGVAAFGLLDRAISSTIGFLGDAVQAAREDEESQSRLGAALKANIPNWDGNTKAIEDVLAARMRLGFSDDEQRKSLALLVVATHDATKALEIQRTAMDLARLKGISLEEASSALIKVEGGQFRALKALGIQLPKNATATEALAAVQKAAAGSAEAFANTNEGKLLRSQVKVGEAMEKIGYVIMPALADATVFVADTFVQLAETIGPITDAVGELEGALNSMPGVTDEAADGLVQFGGKADPIGQALIDLVTEEQRLLAGTYATAEGFTAASNQMGDSLATLAERASESIPAVTASATKLGPAINDGLERGLVATNLTQFMLEQGRRAAAGVAQGIREKRDTVDAAWQSLLDALKNKQSVTTETAKLIGRLSAKELAAGMKSGDPAVRAQAKATLQATLDRLAELKPRSGTISKDAMAELRKAMKSKVPAIREAATDIYNSVIHKLDDTPPKAKTYGKQTGQNFADGIESKVHAAEIAASHLAGAVGSYLKPGSPTDKGPLSTKGGAGGWGELIGKEFARKLMAHLPNLTDALGGPFQLPRVMAPAFMGMTAPDVAARSAPFGAGIQSLAAGGTTVNNIQNVKVEGLVKARDPLEIARQLQRFQEVRTIDTVRRKEPS